MQGVIQKVPTSHLIIELSTIINIKLIIVGTILNFNILAAAQQLSNNAPLLCESHKKACYKAQLDVSINDRNHTQINQLLSELPYLSGHQTWKNHAFGVLYLIKSDPDSIQKAESFLLKAHEQNFTAAVHNLAELYFAKGDYSSSWKYLEISRKFNYKFPTRRYLNFARLRAQILFKGTSEVKDKQKAIELFEKISHYDKTGISFYYLGMTSLKNDKTVKALEYLNKASHFGHIDSKLMLGDLYATGDYFKKDIQKAIEFYSSVTANNDNLKSGIAHYKLFLLYKSEGDLENMREQFKAAVIHKNTDAVSAYNKILKKRGL